MNIRKAVRDDLDQIASIYDRTHDEEEAGNVTIGWIRNIYPVRKTAEDSLERGDLFVMEQDKDIVAVAIINQVQVPDYRYAAWKHQAEDDDVMVLHTLVVDPAGKGKGYGKAFVGFYEQYAREHGCRELRLDTNAINRTARKMYGKLGYEEIDIVPCVFNGISGVSLVCLEKYQDPALSLEKTKEMLCAVCDGVIREERTLTALDGPIGDSDHGIGMRRGMIKAREVLCGEEDFESINELFFRMGRAMIAIMGGSSGVIFGTMFMGAGAGMEAITQLDGKTFVRMMRNSLNRVKKKGKAGPGDKTMVDALEPAVLAMEAEDCKDFPHVLRLAAEAAKKGAEATKDMTALFGHARTLGERSLGHPDPGAVTVTVIFRAMEEYVRREI